MAPGGEVSAAEPGAELVTVATVLHLRKWRYLFPFFRVNSRVFKQLNQTPGLVSLQATSRSCKYDSLR